MKTAEIIYRNSHGLSTTGLASLAGRVLFTTVLILGLGAIAVRAQDDHHSNEAKESEPPKTEIPKTLPGIWAAITEHQQELHHVLANNNLEDVHHVAFSIRDLTTALPDKSTKLSKDKKNNLKASVTRVDGLVKELDEAGDSGDSAAVAALVGKLDLELRGVEALYAAKDLKLPATTAAASKQTYVCPMHPDITSDKPGKCSMCGMALVKKDK